MKKSGFTLAEVLITMGIVGVIAALTTPTLITSSRNQANAAKLSSAISVMENALTSLVISEGTDDIVDTELWNYWEDANGFAEEIGKYLKIISYKYADSTIPEGYSEIKTVNGTSLKAMPNMDGQFISLTLPSGAVAFLAESGVALTTAQEETAAAAGGALFSCPAYLTIDVNGIEAPNRVGRDIFCFIVGPDGKLYPYGGKDVAIFKGGSATSTWNSDSGTYPCTDTTKGNGEGCTARLMEENFKMNY